MIRFFVLFCFLLVQWNSTYAQNERLVHNDVWTSFKLSYQLHKIKFIGEYQHRRQANEFINESNIFHHNEANLLRFWMHYDLPKNFKLIVSPFACINQFNMDEITEEVSQIKQYRTTIGAMHKVHIGKKFNLKNRVLYETQVYPSLKLIAHRYRFKTGFIMQIAEFHKHRKLNFLLFDEVFFRTTSRKTNFNHNRVYTGVKFESGHFDMDLTYKFSNYNDPQEVLGNMLVLSVECKIGTMHSLSHH